ncbi:MAG: hypothetical protein L6Q54_09070 [Leptospiraceae bacterium]|nr:hypothetical protein [Leptospiraceae bacterium]MCK6381383.1 hypothetical protein [Leptospiraceae bacterium]NUM41607.1 hypothetical protein [Leptospiraceae bacterium]
MRVASLTIPIALFFINLYVIIYSETKITEYDINPPFFATDFTESYKLNPQSKIQFIADGKTNTHWIKERDAKNSDFEIELRLTHFFENGYHRKNYKYLKILACEDVKKKITKPENLRITIFKKEAINVDKELRLPKEKSLKEIDVDFSDSLDQKIPIAKDISIQETNHFPENIFILGVRGKITGNSKTSSCISEISFEE